MTRVAPVARSTQWEARWTGGDDHADPNEAVGGVDEVARGEADGRVHADPARVEEAVAQRDGKVGTGAGDREAPDGEDRQPAGEERGEVY